MIKEETDDANVVIKFVRSFVWPVVQSTMDKLRAEHPASLDKREMWI